MRTFLRKVKNVLGDRRDHIEIKRYIETSPVRNLQIGSSSRVLVGWLNTDINRSPDVVRLDATKPFPLPDSSFDNILVEHMIEHITYSQARQMLAECYRILRTGGVLRIITPDLQKLAGLYVTGYENGYVDWFCKIFLPDDQPRTVGSLLNAHFSMWGHQFLYDETLLADAVARAGFNSVVRCEVGESGRAALRRIENESRYPEGFLRLESLAIEAVR